MRFFFFLANPCDEQRMQRELLSPPLPTRKWSASDVVRLGRCHRPSLSTVVVLSLLTVYFSQRLGIASRDWASDVTPFQGSLSFPIDFAR